VVSVTRTALIWLALLGGLFAVFSLLLSRWENPNTRVETMVASDGAVTVVLQRNRSGHFVASGTLDGRPVAFLVDTGATTVAVPRRLAVALDLPQGAPVRLQTAGGTVQGRSTILDEVALGGIRIRNVRGVVLPDGSGDAVLLGMSFLRHLELTQRGDTLILRLPARSSDARSP
jgi:aspartyl protease family protein